MKKSKIEWCDHTFNPWEGCTEVSPACVNCYAAARNARYHRGKAINWGKGAPRRRTSVKNWNLPLQWDREAAATGVRPRVFCASLADWLDPEVPIEWLVDLLDLIRRTPHLDWLLLTKRPENFAPRVRECSPGPSPEFLGWLLDWQNGYAPANIWIGTTVEDQTRADQRIPALVQIPAQVRFLSCEPLLSEISVEWALAKNSAEIAAGFLRRGQFSPGLETLKPIDWVICGGESGPNARPSNPAWFRSLRDQCSNAGAAFFFKQWGEWIGGRLDRRKGKMMCQAVTADLEDGPIFWTNPGSPRTHEWDSPAHFWTDASAKIGKIRAGRLLDGVSHNAFPK